MTQDPGFGAALTLLLDQRELHPTELAERAGLGADEVRTVLAGSVPAREQVRRLAAALGFHALDLFVLAGLAVPDDLAPPDHTAHHRVRQIVVDAARLPPTERRSLLRRVRSLPREERRTPFAATRRPPGGGGPGSRVMLMFRHRNLDPLGLAMSLGLVTPTYLSAVTFHVIGLGRKELTPRLVTDFAALLGLDARELAALTGVPLTREPAPPAPEAVDAAALLWEARRLCAGQAEQVAGMVRSLRARAETPEPR
ncbi:hypothetical protein [Streptomyces subrutilus]|uniref:hypothetical protein n=1 Tax=Streptomyces subrutilus TaxID=36818 RepID=UPI002E0FAED1|nr:hypothetical protein OG479_06965 [Streptomyces subrutilus]